MKVTKVSWKMIQCKMFQCFDCRDKTVLAASPSREYRTTQMMGIRPMSANMLNRYYNTDKVKPESNSLHPAKLPLNVFFADLSRCRVET